MRFVSAACCAAGVALLAGATATAEARSPIVIEGADEDTREAILDLLPDRDRPESLFDAERIAEEAAARATAWLRSEGYYAAEVTPEAQETPPLARLIIAPGRRFSFTAPELAFTGAAPNPDATGRALQAIARVEPDAPARAADVLAAEAEALKALREAGYADAAPGQRRVVVDHATGKVTANFQIAAGDFARLGALRASPDSVLRAEYTARLRSWTPGDAFTPEKLAQLRRDILTTGAVSRASTTLAPPGADGLRDVVLEIEAAKRNAYEAGVGYSTTEGFGVEAEWTRRNFTRRADSLTVSTTLAEISQKLNFELLRPHAAGLGYARRYGFAISREESEAFTRQGAALSASVEASPRLALGVSYGAQLSADSFTESAGVRNAIVLTAFGEVRNDTRANRLDPRDGSLVEIRIEPSVAAGDASLAFVRSTADARIYESFTDTDSLTLAARARVGWIASVSGDINDAPPDRRFYAGGGGSVRGYEYNSIYPRERDALGLTPGGQGLLETSIEARWRFGERYGAAAFIDGGNAFDDWGQAADLRWGVGIGARYDLGFAPLRVDIAAPLDARDGDPDYALYISLGQAF